jgi:magnesium chelatase family protein
MSVAVLYSRSLSGVHAPLVTVEVHLSGGLPAINIVGLPEAEVRESRDRVKAALQNAAFEFPQRKVTINLAPADVPKESARFDLPIAIGILAASGQVPAEALKEYEFAGELALTGELRPVRGAFAMALQSRADGRTFVLPAQSAQEAANVPTAQILGPKTLLEVVAHLHGREKLPFASVNASAQATSQTTYPDLNEVKGQAHAKRALEIAAAGRHSMLMIGPPGTGKSMLAQRLPGILPPMTDDEAMESASVLSLIGKFRAERYGERPISTPHHTASAVALVGGGSEPRPGEISISHKGVLFLDELPEFDRKVLEVLREPLEAGKIHISRAARQAEFPADFQLIAAMNPCPCGYLGHASSRCRCTPDQVLRYRGKISGPLMDRLDLQIEVPSMPAQDMMKAADGEDSAAVRVRVIAAVERQLARQNKPNSRLSPKEIDTHCALDDAAAKLMASAIARLGLSARAHHRILRVARTIADLAGAAAISTAHVAEAIGYRKGLDKR